MYNLHTEVPSGALSKGYDYDDLEKAARAAKRICAQLVEMHFIGVLILSENGVEVNRSTFDGN